jgi:lipopolysaccharide/colanic/teichoic acid biosynthesis glycosyltransferase
MDVAVSALSLVALSPLLAIVWFLVLLRMGRPAIFRQRRPGRCGRPFTVYKFRTMTDARGPDGRLLPDAQRFTGLGRFLRASSLDELPQLWNVLRGDLSLVGPRPLLMEYLERYTPEQARRHEVRPGITGLAQITGRNAMPFSKRLELDVYYVDHGSLAMDLKILVLTVLRVLGRRLDDGAGQDVTVVDDLGLHPDTRALRVAAANSQEVPP